mmetsp:Transcript_1101/g.3419  ORF Transcript_1101/g.3419 Transcript_1101/m.3419 type:complete len:82 (+) Transcript_1101:2-247(+)
MRYNARTPVVILLQLFDRSKPRRPLGRGQIVAMPGFGTVTVLLNVVQQLSVKGSYEIRAELHRTNSTVSSLIFSEKIVVTV